MLTTVNLKPEIGLNDPRKTQKGGFCETFMVLKNFRERYCNAHAVELPAFSKSIILETCYPQARPFYRTILRMGETRVEAELNLLHDLASAESLGNLEGMVNGVYFATYLRTLGVVRKKLKLRLSGTRIVKAARSVFES